jgi:hypothetical protein
MLIGEVLFKIKRQIPILRWVKVLRIRPSGKFWIFRGYFCNKKMINCHENKSPIGQAEQISMAGCIELKFPDSIGV